MADRGDTHYSVSSLNAWFMLSSVLLFGALVWMMINDHNRPWKQYQREFKQLELVRAEAEARELEEAGATETEAALQRQVAEAQSALEAREAELSAARESLRLARGELWKSIEEAKKAKSQFNWDRYKIEEERRHLGDPDHRAVDLAASELLMNQLVGAQQVAQAKADQAQAQADALTANLAQAEKALAAGTRDLNAVRKRIDAIDPTDPAKKLANVIRDAPGLDFIGPSLVVKKEVLKNLDFDLNFTKKQRIDMCMTCHLGIDRAGFEDEPQPYTTHPRQDLYLSSNSPHPIKEVGCTICHRGSGEALDFIRSDHRPDTQAQQVEWEEEYEWHKQHHWDYPMLQTSRVEASCIQCHKTTMELIAEDAPTVFKGYELFERYGCYACHKVDWFPTERRPGPSLLNLQAKLDEGFVSAWVQNPKDFRPSTWMPQFFHLENFAADQVVTVADYGQGRAMLGGEWDDAAVEAVVAFLLDRAPKQPYPALPVEGDVEQGRETMRLVGCWACHNAAPFGGEPAPTRDLALEERGSNEHGPNLRGVATKINREWLFAWLKDPAAYWPETRMPDLRLSDQEAADIAAYIMEDPDGIFRDVPEGWEPTAKRLEDAKLREVLAEQARWYFSRESRSTLRARLEGRDPANRWDDLEELKVAVGEKVVGHYGCFSCHEIAGMQDMMPIGTELSNWGSKTVDKLDFGFGTELFGLDHSYREGWLEQKLHAPRSFDQKKVKNPSEKLRMPWFNFTDDEVHAIATFVVGLVDDEVQRAKMVPTPAEQVMDDGLRVVRQNNCLACHMVEPGLVTYEHEDGRVVTVQAELLPIGDDPIPPAHDLAKVKSDLEYWETEEVIIRLLRPEPTIGKGVGEREFIPADKLLGLQAPKGGDMIRLVTDYYFNGIELHDPEAENEDDAFWRVTADPDGELKVADVDGVFRDHAAEPYDKVRWTFAPPVLWEEGEKVQKGWFYAFLHDVVPLRPQIRVRMPSFTFREGEAQAVASYFAHAAVQSWPARYARALRLSQGLDAEAFAAQAKGLTARTVLSIEDGYGPDITASFDKVKALGDAAGFTLAPPLDPDYEASLLRSHAHLTRREAELPDHLQVGQAIAVDAVNCFQCHFRLGQPPAADPIAWAPDLALTKDRLREDWVRVWLEDPAQIYPGTAMPANFTSDPPQYQEQYPDSTNREQIQVVLEWLYNLDRVLLEAVSQN
ncbi:MAG TPA: cytochrome c [Planctomycetota bacterium]|nr:cytochrome c [Planctomycetota bacterium]